MRGKEFYQELGYSDAVEYYRKNTWEDTGYLSPDLSTNDTYPSYLKGEAKISADDVNSHKCNSDSFTFGFMTDLHYATTENHRIRMTRMINTYKDICDKTGNYILLLGGDFTNEGCKEYKSECFCELKKQLSGVNYYPANGNHDDGTIWDIAYIDNDKSINHLTQEDRYDLFYNHLPQENAVFPNGEEKTLYYYVDDAKTKTRYIALDASDVPQNMENGKLKHSGQWTFAMSQRQVDWFVNTALRFEQEGWSAIVFLHSMTPPPPIADHCNRSKEKWYLNHIDDIADAFKAGGKLDALYYDDDYTLNVKADFSNYVKGEIIAFFAGDFHSDMVDYTKEGIPKIFTGNAVTYRGGQNKPPRDDGDKSELLFDMVTVDKSKRNIHITRVGCGDDRDVEF